MVGRILCAVSISEEHGALALPKGRSVKTTALRYGLLASLLAACLRWATNHTLAHRFADVRRAAASSARARQADRVPPRLPHFWYQWHRNLRFSQGLSTWWRRHARLHWSSSPGVEPYRIEYLIEDIRAS